MEDVRIYIAEQRGELMMNNGLVRSILNYQQYVSPHRGPIGSLHHVNEWSGYAGKVFQMPLPRQSISVFVPLAGEIVIQVKNQEYMVSLGNVLVLPIDTETEVWARALGKKGDYFCFQQFVFCDTASSTKDVLNCPLPIVKYSDKDRLQPVLQKGVVPFQLYVGAFVGKIEDKLDMSSNYHHIFAMALDGNFEVEQRILFQGDALFLPEYNTVEVECLSATGLVLLFNF